MNNIEKQLIKHISNVFTDVKEYITSNENWIYYFIDNKDVFQFLTKNPSNWKDEVNMKIEHIEHNLVKVAIRFEDENGEEIILKGNIILSNFEIRVKCNYIKMQEDILSYKIKEKEDELEYFEKRCKEVRKDIEDLKKQQK